MYPERAMTGWYPGPSYRFRRLLRRPILRVTSYLMAAFVGV